LTERGGGTELSWLAELVPWLTRLDARGPRRVLRLAEEGWESFRGSSLEGDGKWKGSFV
jgi:hypothetical protein